MDFLKFVLDRWYVFLIVFLVMKAVPQINALFFKKYYVLIEDEEKIMVKGFLRCVDLIEEYYGEYNHAFLKAQSLDSIIYINEYKKEVITIISCKQYDCIDKLIEEIRELGETEED